VNTNEQIKKIKKICIYLLFFILGTAISGRIIFRLFTDDTSLEPRPETDLAELRVQELIYEPETYHSVDGLYYNFKKMVRLIDACSSVKKALAITFKDNVPTQTKYHKNITPEYLSGLIDELYQEKRLLKNYILDLKGYASDTSFRKYRSLHYYLGVLENNLADLNILRQRTNTKLKK